MIQNMITIATIVLNSDHHCYRGQEEQRRFMKQLTGVTNGLPKKAIIDQSKVKIPIPRPVFVPNRALTVRLLGAIQQTQLNILSAVKRYPGRK